MGKLAPARRRKGQRLTSDRPAAQGLAAAQVDLNLCRSSVDRFYFDSYGEAVTASSKDDAPQGRHITEVSAPRDGDVVGSDKSVIRWIELEPSERGCIHRDPCVRGAPPDQRVGACG